MKRLIPVRVVRTRLVAGSLALLLSSHAFAQSGMPSGHPPTGQGAEGGPHAGAPQGPMPDQIAMDPELPAGTVMVHLVDSNDQPLGGAPIVLDIDRNTVAQGESHDEKAARVDAKGEARFDGLKLGSGVTYRVRTERDEATFASDGFSLKEDGGAHVLLHSHEVVKSLADARFVVEAFVVLEIKQDTVRVNHLLRTFTFGGAYLARGLTMKLPPGARAFSQEQTAANATVREKDGSITLEGTFTPGQAEVMYGYTLPLESGPTLRLELPLPPRVLAAQVSVNSGPGMSLEVAGFQTAQQARRRDGQKVLQAVRQIDPSQNPGEFLANVSNGSLDITVGGLPSSGNGPLVAAGLAAIALLAGALQLRGRGSKSVDRELAAELGEARDALLEELAALERAKDSGEVGPKSYERLRAALVDALARILARLESA